jgi:hypothetical protein
MSEQASMQPPGEHGVGERADPRLRPPDPAGTQPKVDPSSLESPFRLSAGQASFLPAPLAQPPAPPAPSAPPASPPTESSAAVDRPREPARPPKQRPHAPRFQFMFGALAALGACAIALVVLLLSAPKPAPEPPWSEWHPVSNGIDPSQQIAEHVAPAYQLDNGKQIVQVTGGPPTQNGQPLTLGVQSSGQAPARLEGNSVMYRMCGDGTDCSIKQGKASTERGLLLSREALELALYTFRYVGGVNQVLVTIPPPPPPSTSTKITNHALLFRAQDFGAQLSQPLDATLAPLTPRVSQMDSSSDASLVATLTSARLHDYVIDEVPESHQSEFVLLLSPPT